MGALAVHPVVQPPGEEVTCPHLDPQPGASLPHLPDAQGHEVDGGLEGLVVLSGVALGRLVQETERRAVGGDLEVPFEVHGPVAKALGAVLHTVLLGGVVIQGVLLEVETGLVLRPGVEQHHSGAGDLPVVATVEDGDEEPGDR